MGSASQAAEASLQNNAVALRTEGYFWRHVEKSDNGCWLWIAHRDRYGYGGLHIRGCTLQSHRISWALANGLIPDGMCVLHRCDVRNCVNPAHLFLGTKGDNVADMAAKKRNARGVTQHLATLTDESVREIRHAYASGEANQSELGRRFGVTKENISCVVRRATWKHI